MEGSASEKEISRLLDEYLAGIEARKNVLEHLHKMVRYKNSAPGLLDLVITVMTDKGTSLPEGKRQAASGNMPVFPDKSVQIVPFVREIRHFYGQEEAAQGE